jgi:hypothetical protein
MAAPRGIQTPEPVSGEPCDDATVIARSLDDPGQFVVVFPGHAPDIHRYVVRRLGPAGNTAPRPIKLRGQPGAILIAR